MLSINARGSAKTAASYYAHLDTGREGEIEDYYAAEGAGKWAGRGAAALGLEGEVSEADFVALAQGFDLDGNALTQNSGQESHRAGWDLTFSAPKSVSVAWALADDDTHEKIAEAHDRAVLAGLDYMERHAGVTRRGYGGARDEQAGLVVSTFRHGTSREQDPQLHSHCFVHNAAVREDATTGTIESWHLYAWQKAGGAAYRVALADEMQRLGFTVERDGEFFRLAEIDAGLEREFSTRREQIEAALDERGLSGARAAERAALDTRRAKELGSAEALRESWFERAAGYSHEHQMTASRDHHQAGIEAQHMGAGGGLNSDEKLIDGAWLGTEATKTNSTFSRAQAHALGLQEAQGKSNLERAEGAVEEILESPEVIRLQAVTRFAKYGERFTTQEMLDLEQELVDRAEQMHERVGHVVEASTVDSVLDGENFRTLSVEQREAVQYLAESGDVATIQGAAGAGKSFALGAAREVWEQAGFEVIGVAQSGQAAQSLENGSGIRSRTVSSFLGRAAPGIESEEREQFEGREAPADALTERSVVVVDEAAMLGSRQLSDLAQAAETRGAKLVLVGDTQQLQAIEAGAAFRTIQERVGGAELFENRRQELEADREAVALLRAGDAEAALKNLSARGRVHETESAREAKTALGHAVADDLAQGKDALGIASTRQDARDINKAARERMRETGLLSGEDTQVLTRSGLRQFAAGDRVVFGRNTGGKAADEMGGAVRNGDRGRIVEIEAKSDEAKITVELDRGGSRTFISVNYDHIEHAYAVTAHKSQGATVDSTHVLGTETAMPSSKEWGYVSGSRHRREVHVYADSASLETLAPTWQKERQKDSTLDYQI